MFILWVRTETFIETLNYSQLQRLACSYHSLQGLLNINHVSLEMRDDDQDCSGLCSVFFFFMKSILYCILRSIINFNDMSSAISKIFYMSFSFCHQLDTAHHHFNIINMAAELLQATGGRMEQLEQQTRQMTSSSHSASSTFTWSSSNKLRKISQGLSKTMDGTKIILCSF